MLPLTTMKALALVRSELTRHELARLLVEIPSIRCEFTDTKALDRVDADIIFVEIDVTDATDVALIASLKTREAGADIVALTMAGTPQDILRVVRAGAEDVLVHPIDARELRDVITRLSEHKAKNNPDTAPRALLLTFAHASGGVGATTLAVNAAMAIGQKCQPGDACILDFDIQFGSVASHLDLPPFSPIRDLVNDPDRLDREMLESMMSRHESGLRVLTAPRLSLPLEAFTASIVARILETAQRHFRFVIVDLPHGLTSWSDTVLRRSNRVYLIAQLGVPGIHQLKKYYDVLLEEQLDDLPLRLVINRVQGALAKGSDVSAVQIERATGHSVHHRIPNDYGLVMASLNQGKPLMTTAPTSRIAQSIRDMLADAVGADYFEERRSPVGLAALSQKFFRG